MPSHLQQIEIDVDKDLEKWATENSTQYTAVGVAPPPARLEVCVAAGREAALRSQRENIIIKLFPQVRSYQPLRIYI